MIREVYLDNSATTKPRNEVVDAMMVPLTTVYGNPSSLHSKGVEIEKLIKHSRQSLANMLKCQLDEVCFTSGGTEANNIAIMGTILANKKFGNHIITSKFEHSSVLNTFKALENEGYRVTYLDITNDGFIKLEQLEELIDDKTALVSVMYVNSEVGTIQPIDEVVRIVKQKNTNTKIHIDSVQAFSKIDTYPNTLGVDLMTVSSHKIHGPKGVGALFAKKGTKINSLFYGGGQESSIRPGTENVPGIIGFGKAIEVEQQLMNPDNERIKKLREDLENKILSNISDTILNGNREKRAPHIANISFLGIRGEVLLHSLAEKGIFISTGSACSSRKSKHSHVLEAMGVKTEGLDGAIRFSLGAFNTQEDIDYCMENLIPIVQKLRMFKRR